jgi:hypothetical protein
MTLTWCRVRRGQVCFLPAPLRHGAVGISIVGFRFQLLYCIHAVINSCYTVTLISLKRKLHYSPKICNPVPRLFHHALSPHWKRARSSSLSLSPNHRRQSARTTDSGLALEEGSQSFAFQLRRFEMGIPRNVTISNVIYTCTHDLISGMV